MVGDALARADVKNVLAEASMAVEATTAQAGLHTLSDGNTMLALSVATSDRLLLYFELSQPLEGHSPSGRAFRFQSQALVYALDEEGGKLSSTSVNGVLVARPSDDAVVAQLDCGNCDPYPYGAWTYEGASCVGWTWDCVWRSCGGTCGACAALCAISPWSPGCWACLTIACPWCFLFACCQSWEDACVSCG